MRFSAVAAGGVVVVVVGGGGATGNRVPDAAERKDKVDAESLGTGCASGAAVVGGFPPTTPVETSAAFNSCKSCSNRATSCCTTVADMAASYTRGHGTKEGGTAGTRPPPPPSPSSSSYKWAEHPVQYDPSAWARPSTVAGCLRGLPPRMRQAVVARLLQWRPEAAAVVVGAAAEPPRLSSPAPSSSSSSSSSASSSSVSSPRSSPVPSVSSV